MPWQVEMVVTSPQSRNSQAIPSYLPDSSTRFLQETVGILTRRSQQSRHMPAVTSSEQGQTRAEQADVHSHSEAVLGRTLPAPWPPVASEAGQSSTAWAMLEPHVVVGMASPACHAGTHGLTELHSRATPPRPTSRPREVFPPENVTKGGERGRRLSSVNKALQRPFFGGGKGPTNCTCTLAPP